METQIRTAVKTAIEASGVKAVGKYENTAAGRDSAPVAAVGISSATVKSVGLGSYIGCEERAGISVEIYGKRVDALAEINVFSPRTCAIDERCAAVQSVLSALLNNMPTGMRAGEIKQSGEEFDGKSEMFTVRLTAVLDAYFTAEAEDGEPLSDFKLKGVINI